MRSNPESKDALGKIAKNKNVLRAQLRRLSLTDIEKILELAGEVQSEKQIVEAQHKEAERQRQEQVAELRKMMEEQGITPDELVGEAKPKRGRPRKSAAKQ